MIQRLALPIVLLLVVFVAQSTSAAEPASVQFNRDIRPLLSDNCLSCHGFDKNARKADLRLDTRDGLFSTIDGRPMILPGRPAESEIYKRLVTDDLDERMPHRKSNKRLTAPQIALIKKWIEQGAPWEGHWAFTKLTQPPLPHIENQEPKKGSEKAIARDLKNPLDAFVLANLSSLNLSPSPHADRVTLIRRLSFDLIGLPPTPAEVEAFINDKSPDAYEKLVDRLLASPHFGERMAAFWLDLVRFADTIGYHSDNPMNIWPYRDYVINAFNSNKPFDQFSIEQIAGDLLPNATLEQKVASGYNRLLQTTEEGGAQPKEYTIKYAADRVRNVSTAWLGVTMGCAECHDHKFDPISQKDFYSLAAFFADIQEAAVGKREPGMPVPNAEQQAKLKQYEDQIESLKKEIDQVTPELFAAQADWEKQLSTPTDWQPLESDSATVQGESKLQKDPADPTILRSVYKLSIKETYTIKTKLTTQHAAHSTLPITGFRLEALDDDAYPERGPGGAPNGNFVLTEFKVSIPTDDAKKPKSIKLQNVKADHSQDAYPVANSIDNKDETGWAILPQVGKPHFAVYETAEPLKLSAGDEITFTLEFKSQFPQHMITKLRLSATTTPQPSLRWLPPNLQKIVAIASDQRTDDQKKQLLDYYRTLAPFLQPARQQLAKLQKEKEDFLKAIPTTLVSIAGKPRTVRLLLRGNWLDETGPIMQPDVPQFLAQLTPFIPSLANRKAQTPNDRPTRLDLAQWLVSKDNPLTPRVFVNRLFKQYFGYGISKNQEDIGSQGEWPIHPELLDYLASEFVSSNWNIKHMVRLMVTSSAYRQSSLATREQRERDPENRLLARGSRFRHDAETVRDNALVISGLLVPTIGGPSVKPYQPAGYWDFLNFPPRTWQHDKGESQYRRALYTHWQRSFLHPSLVAFDAPSREECTGQRVRSNIPQQALVLLNDPTHVEAATAFASRIMQQGGSTFQSRLDFAFLHALSRKPSEKESQILRALHDKHLKQFSTDPGSATALLSTGLFTPPKDIPPADLAAWTNVARAILNLHETITRN